MTATQAPTPGPLTSESVKLLVKGDLLRVTNADSFLEANGVKDGSVVRFRSADNTWIDLQEMDFPQGSSFARFAFIGRPDESGWMPWSGGDPTITDPTVDIEVRLRNGELHVDRSPAFDWTYDPEPHPFDIIAFRLAPTAPVEASGSERDIGGETFMGFRVAAWRYRQGDETEKLPHHYAEHWSTPGASAWGIQRLFTEDQLQQALNLRPQPSGETREQCAACSRGEVTHFSTDDGFWVEITTSAGGANEHGLNGWFETLEHYPDGLTKRREYVATDSPALSTTPARAEAQDEDTPCTDCGDTGFTHQTERRCSCQEAEAQYEGAAGLWDRIEHQMWLANALEFVERSSSPKDACEIIDRLLAVIDALSPSPTPAADDDRVRIAVEAFNAKINAPLTGPTHGAWDRGRIAGLKEALAALKSTAAKEGEE